MHGLHRARPGRQHPVRADPAVAVEDHKAFEVIQLDDVTALPALAFYANTAVVLAGTNVYTIDDVDGTNDPIPTSLLNNLVNRVQALYKHH